MFKLIMLLACFVLSPYGLADEGAEYIGRVDSIADEYKGLVLDDATFMFTLNAKIFDLKGKEINRFVFKVGDVVKYRIAVGANGYNQLTHVWLLPPGSNLNSNESGGV